MYELNDSYFMIFNPSYSIIVGVVIILAILGFFILRAKKRRSRA